MYTNCPFCRRRDTVVQNICMICYFDFDIIDKKSDFSYDNKLNYFKKTLKMLSGRMYYDVSGYKDGTYKEILQQLPVNKRKSFVNIQNLIKLIKNDNRKLTEEMIEIILKYYKLYMEFLYETKIKISNIKLLYFIINRLNLDYTIYVNLKSEDLKNFEKFTNFLSRNNKC